MQMNVEVLEEELKRIVSQRSPDAEIRGMVEYAILGGKLVRSRICLATVEDLGGCVSTNSNIRAALSLELIHSSSLLHDDLPAIDNDDYRRGKLSFHKVFGDGRAVLIGDLLIGLAMENLANLSLTEHVITRLLRRASSSYSDLCLGQVLDLRENKDFASTNSLKTASLFATTLAFGGLLANLPEGMVNQLSDLGQMVGMLFQALDDYDDDEVDLAAAKEDIESKRLGVENCLLTVENLLSRDLHQLRSILGLIGILDQRDLKVGGPNVILRSGKI